MNVVLGNLITFRVGSPVGVTHQGKHPIVTLSDTEDVVEHVQIMLNGGLPERFYQSVSEFWRARSEVSADAETHATTLATKEETQDREEWEQEQVRLMWPKDCQTVIEPACGVGRWTQWLSPRCQRVYSYDFIKEFADEVRALRLENVEVSVSDMKTPVGVCGDLLFSAGTAVYMSESDLEDFFRHYQNVEYILLVESFSQDENLLLLDYPSERLGCNYSAMYRTAQWWRTFMAGLGYRHLKSAFKYQPDPNRSTRGVVLFQRDTSASS